MLEHERSKSVSAKVGRKYANLEIKKKERRSSDQPYLSCRFMFCLFRDFLFETEMAHTHQIHYMDQIGRDSHLTIFCVDNKSGKIVKYVY